MGLLNNSIAIVSLTKRTKLEAFFYFLKGISRECHIFPSFFERMYNKISQNKFLEKWLKSKNGVSCFDFNGALLPDVSISREKISTLSYIFNDIYLIYCYYNDNYKSDFVKLLDEFIPEGPYGYQDKNFNVTISNGDIVVDAGAWIGDFSAYASNIGAKVYAFEPVNSTYNWLIETAKLNSNIIPINKGLSNKNENVLMSICGENSGGNTSCNNAHVGEQSACFITLDEFVKEYNVEKVDFIKADIEGAERKLLLGAKETLKKFAPKLAICTYHLPDDPEVLEKIIKDANPKYQVVHLRHKLFAMVNSDN